MVDSPVAYYRLDEAAGPTMCDSSSAVNNGTYNSSGVTYGVTGALVNDSDTGVAADGTNGVIGTSDSNSSITGAGPTQSFTLEGWFRSTGIIQDQALVAVGNPPHGSIAGLTVWTPGTCGTGGSKVGLDEYNGANCWDTTLAGVNLFDGQWHQVAVTYDATSGVVTGYVDGESLGGQTSDVNFDLSASPVRVGNWVDTVVNQHFIGDADEVAVYPSALSAVRIAAHYDAAGYSLSNTQKPMISGSPTQGQTLSTTNGSWMGNPDSFVYQWEDCDASGNDCANVASGGSASSYTLTGGDVGHTMRVIVTAQRGPQSSSATSDQTQTVSPLAASTPAVSLSTTRLDFGTIGVGKPSAAQTVTVSNIGTGPLTISRTAISGANASDFSLSSDTCNGATVAPGASCSTDVVFTPPATGSRDAQLAFTDNASGSPQTVSLAGAGSDTGGVRGTVTNRNNTSPAAGATVSVCTYSTRAVCESATTDGRGDYSVTGLPAGTYQVEALPAGGSLFAGSAVVDVVAGAPVVQDFQLNPPQPLPSGFTLSSSVGTFSSGVPVSFWQDPTQLSVPITAPTGGAPGDVGSTDVTFWAGPSGSGGVDRPWGNLIVTFAYDSSGTPRYTGMYATGTPSSSKQTIGTWTMGLGQDPVVGQSDVNSLTALGTLTPPPGGPYFHGGTDMVTSESADVLERVAAAKDRAHRAGNNFSSYVNCKQPLHPTQRQPQPRNRMEELQQQLQYWQRQYAVDRGTLSGFGTQSGPPNVPRDLQNINNIQQQINQLTQQQAQQQRQQPVQQNQPTQTYPNGYGPAPTTGQPGPSSQSQAGSFTQNNTTYYDGGGWQNSSNPGPPDDFVPHASNPGPSNPGPPDDFVPHARDVQADDSTGDGCSDDNSFSHYLDPSGVVETRQHVPIAGAKVVLLRSVRRNGRFRQVPNGSRIMSPANRRNPDRTTALGNFGWDVLTGFYRISAEVSGCRARALTKVLKVPPPAFNLKLVLACSVARTATHTSVNAKRIASGDVVLLIAHVKGRRARRHPVGIVTFTAGGRRLGIAPINTRTSTATLTVSASRIHGRVRAQYGGDGYFSPSRS